MVVLFDLEGSRPHNLEVSRSNPATSPGFPLRVVDQGTYIKHILSIDLEVPNE
jgi:hypothetical protein